MSGEWQQQFDPLQQEINKITKSLVSLAKSAREGSELKVDNSNPMAKKLVEALIFHLADMNKAVTQMKKDLDSVNDLTSLCLEHGAV